MDRVADEFPILVDTDVWKKHVADFKQCLKAAAKVLLKLAGTLESDLRARVDVDRARYRNTSMALVALLVSANSGRWNSIVAEDAQYMELYQLAKREAMGSLELMDSAPVDRVERELWLQDLEQVILEAQKGQREGITSLSREVEAFRSTQRRLGMTRQQISDALELPKLSAHMRLIYDAVVSEMDRLEAVIDEKTMGRNTYIQEFIDFSEFGIGSATIRFTVSQSELDPRPRKNLNLKWFTQNHSVPLRVKQMLEEATPTLPVSADNHLRSKRELTRFLFWLDSTLTDAQRAAAKTWDKPKPRRGATEEGVSV